LLFADLEEGEVEGSTVTGAFSDDDAASIDDGDWSGSESASVIAARIRQQAIANGFGRTAPGMQFKKERDKN
jgi:hypothetical protein